MTATEVSLYTEVPCRVLPAGASAFTTIAAQLGQPAAACRSDLEQGLSNLQKLAALARQAGMAETAAALERKCEDPRCDLDRLLRLTVRAGGQHQLPSNKANRIAADQALAGLIADPAAPCWRQAGNVLAMLEAGDARAKGVFSVHSLPTTQKRLAERLKRPAAFRETPAATDASSDNLCP